MSTMLTAEIALILEEREDIAAASTPAITKPESPVGKTLITK